MTICQTSVSSNHHFVIARKGGVLELVGGKVHVLSYSYMYMYMCRLVESGSEQYTYML